MRTALAALGLLTLLVVAAPVHGALRVTNVAVPAEEIRPVLDVAPVQFSVEIDCSSVLARRDPTQSPPAIDLVLAEHAHVVVFGMTQHPIPANACPTPVGTAQFDLVYFLEVRATAPALQDLELTYEGHLRDIAIDDGAQTAGNFSVRAAPVLRASVHVPQRIQSCRCYELLYNVTVVNDSNVRARFEVVATDVPVGLQVAVPAPFELEWAGADLGSVSTTFTLTIPVPAEAGLVTFELRSSAAARPEFVGEPQTFSILAKRDNNRYGDEDAANNAFRQAPAAPFALVAFAALASAHLARRRA